jgi:hypothetical protein
MKFNIQSEVTPKLTLLSNDIDIKITIRQKDNIDADDIIIPPESFIFEAKVY